MKVHDLLEKVHDQESFLKFAQVLQEDREDEDQKELTNPSNTSDGHNGWQNHSISSFLESSLAFVEDYESWNEEENLWKKFALFLHGGKSYE